jgi:hypothetical protein
MSRLGHFLFGVALMFGCYLYLPRLAVGLGNPPSSNPYNVYQWLRQHPEEYAKYQGMSNRDKLWFVVTNYSTRAAEALHAEIKALESGDDARYKRSHGDRFILFALAAESLQRYTNAFVTDKQDVPYLKALFTSGLYYYLAGDRSRASRVFKQCRAHRKIHDPGAAWQGRPIITLLERVDRVADQPTLVTAYRIILRPPARLREDLSPEELEKLRCEEEEARRRERLEWPEREKQRLKGLLAELEAIATLKPERP